MLMMCWFYCIPFAKGLFFALSLLLILFSLFALKRGVYQERFRLRQMAFILMFFAFVKIFTVDLYLLKDKLLCGRGEWSATACTTNGVKVLQAAGLGALVLCSVILFHFYRRFIYERQRKLRTPEQVHLRAWANISMVLVMILIFWLAAPWLGYLTVGHIPQVFMQVPWQHLALLTMMVLLIGFWKLEDCHPIHEGSGKKKQVTQVWMAKDTLWLSVILFLIVLAFSYASNDILSGSSAQRGDHFQVEDTEFEFLDHGFRMPDNR